MGRVFDFAKRRTGAFFVFWFRLLLFLGLFYGNHPPPQAGAFFILAIAFIGPLLYPRRLKRKQRPRRETQAALRMQVQAIQPPQRTPSPPPSQPMKQMPGR